MRREQGIDQCVPIDENSCLSNCCPDDNTTRYVDMARRSRERSPLLLVSFIAIEFGATQAGP